MEPDKKEYIQELVGKCYESYYSLLTKEEGNHYSEEILTGDNNWHIAFEFIMGHLMARGRNDKTSALYSKFYLCVLKLQEQKTQEEINKIIEIIEEVLKSIENKKIRIQTPEVSQEKKTDEKLISGEEFIEKFNEHDCNHIIKGKGLNPNDIAMIHDLLIYQKCIFKDENKNLFDSLVKIICEDGVYEAYKKLMNIKMLETN